MYKLFLTLRYLRRKWIAVFAMLSVWLCVAMVLIVFSVMDGFLENIKQHSRGLLSDIIVDVGTLQGFPYYDDFSAYMLQQMPDRVEAVTPVIYNYAILRVKTGRAQNMTQPVRIVAIDLEGYASVNTFREGLYYEKYYPGLTTFDKAALPLAGLADATTTGATTANAATAGLPAADTNAPAGDFAYVLPAEFEQAFARYRKGHPQEAAAALQKANAHAPHGVGNFENAFAEPDHVGTELPGLIVGMDVIYTRGADGEYDRTMVRGEEMVLTILPMTRKGTLVENPVPLAVRLVDESRTRVYQIDDICVYADFKLVQKLLSMDALERVDGTFTRPRATQLLVRTRPGVNVRATTEDIDRLWSEFCMKIFFDMPASTFRSLADEEHKLLWRRVYEGWFTNIDPEDAILMAQVGVETWEDRQQDFIQAVEKEKVLVTILFLIISVVAIVLIGVIFHMIVLQKTRDIGIVKSLGATSWGVAAIFLTYGAAVGVVGGVLGVVSGSIFVHYINEIQDLLASFNANLRVWSPEVYTFDRIPNEVKPDAAISVFAAAVITSMLGAAWPAIKAGRVWPVQALRYE